MVDTLAPSMAFPPELSHPPQATISLYQTSLTNPDPTTPGYYHIGNEIAENGESKKPTKKRKSWGQELPTPKTNLPPRKRAKTDDEKEQRRIERVIRNRQAAQTSRERKRQEVEKLEGEKMSIEQQNDMLKARLLTAEHEKFLLEQKVAKLLAQMKSSKDGKSVEMSPPPESDLDQKQRIKQELDDYASFLPINRNSFLPAFHLLYVLHSQHNESRLRRTDVFQGHDTTSCRDVVRPAVSVRGPLSTVDSAYDSPTNDPIIYNDEKHNFSNLLASDLSFGDDFDVFNDGYAPTTVDDEKCNDGFFNSLFDQDTTSGNYKEANHLASQENLITQHGEAPLEDQFSHDAIFSAPITDVSSVQQS
ncbi:hypothetical protein ACLMJK_004369 [Lecanora helva]